MWLPAVPKSCLSLCQSSCRNQRSGILEFKVFSFLMHSPVFSDFLTFAWVHSKCTTFLRSSFFTCFPVSLFYSSIFPVCSFLNFSFQLASPSKPLPIPCIPFVPSDFSYITAESTLHHNMSLSSSPSPYFHSYFSADPPSSLVFFTCIYPGVRKMVSSLQYACM